MDIEAAVESIWQHTLRRSYFPQEWRGRLTIEQAYRVQLGPRRWVARGERLARVEGRADGAGDPEAFGMPEPVMGFLLESGHATAASGSARRAHPARFRERAVPDGGTRLEGPNVTRAQARAAITAVRPAFEIIETAATSVRT
jgi:2-keto-4-pentenoate hydratase